MTPSTLRLGSIALLAWGCSSGDANPLGTTSPYGGSGGEAGAGGSLAGQGGQASGGSAGANEPGGSSAGEAGSAGSDPGGQGGASAGAGAAGSAGAAAGMSGGSGGSAAGGQGGQGGMTCCGAAMCCTLAGTFYETDAMCRRAGEVCYEGAFCAYSEAPACFRRTTAQGLDQYFCSLADQPQDSASFAAEWTYVGNTLPLGMLSWPECETP